MVIGRTGPNNRRARGKQSAVQVKSFSSTRRVRTPMKPMRSCRPCSRRPTWLTRGIPPGPPRGCARTTAARLVADDEDGAGLPRQSRCSRSALRKCDGRRDEFNRGSRRPARADPGRDTPAPAIARGASRSRSRTTQVEARCRPSRERGVDVLGASEVTGVGLRLAKRIGSRARDRTAVQPEEWPVDHDTPQDDHGQRRAGGQGAGQWTSTS